jgi:hypothetical protein
MTQASVLRRSFPTPFAVIGWLTKTRRRIWCLVLLLLAMIAGPPIWWATQLIGLQDVGDPFDVAAFRALTIPDDRNAFVLYRQAAALLDTRAEYLKTAGRRVDWLARWSDADPQIKRWLEENREALAVYRQGAERPDALDPDTAVYQASYRTHMALWHFHTMSLLEASRLEEQTDMSGAWGSYRALLRTMHHVGMHGDILRRNAVLRWHRVLRDRVRAWAAEATTTPAILRQALRDVVACEALAPSEQYSLKAGYLEVMSVLDQPTNPGREVPLGRFAQFYHPDYTLNPEQIQAIWDWWRFWRHEPERGRRVIRLLTANWLAYHNLHPKNRPKPDPRVTSFDLYPLGEESPAQARALSPEAVERWFDSSCDAQQVLNYVSASGTRTIEQANDAEILMLLAEALYRRDHGTDPPSPEALVGAYLDRLPEGYRTDQKAAKMPGASGVK